MVLQPARDVARADKRNLRSQSQNGIADHKVESPEEVCKVGDQIEVKILRVDSDERKIGLSRKRVEWNEELHGDGESPDGSAPQASPPKPSSPPAELKGGVGGESGPLIKPASK